MAPRALTLDNLTDNHLWALLTVAEHPQRIRLGDPAQHGRYQLHTQSVQELYRDHWLTATIRDYLDHEGSGPARADALQRAQCRFDSYSFPSAGLHHRPQHLTDPERAFLLDHQAEGSQHPSHLTPAQDLMIVGLHQRALMETVPQRPGQVRVSAAGLIAIGRQPATGGLARMCAEARYHNGSHWSPDRHHRYTGLCTPPGAPATTWRRDVTRAMHLIGERHEAEQAWRALQADYRRRENDVYAALPYELNYYPFTYPTGDDDE